MTKENDVHISPNGDYILINNEITKTENPLRKKYLNENKQILSTVSRRRKHRDCNDDQLERKIKVIERLKKKLNEKKQNDKQDK